MITVLCVLKSGGIYDAEWVGKLQRGVKRHLSSDHRFACLSDVDVPCERIKLNHNWPGWWAKCELFAPWVVKGPTLYLDLDSVITGSMDWIHGIEGSFAMLRSFHNDAAMCPVGSGVMWFKDRAPTSVYEKFAKAPYFWMRHHKEHQDRTYVGDQAFIFDEMRHSISFLPNAAAGIVSYKYHCKDGLPDKASVVCFHGAPRPNEIKADWMTQAWA